MPTEIPDFQSVHDLRDYLSSANSRALTAMTSGSPGEAYRIQQEADAVRDEYAPTVALIDKRASDPILQKYGRAGAYAGASKMAYNAQLHSAQQAGLIPQMAPSMDEVSLMVQGPDGDNALANMIKGMPEVARQQLVANAQKQLARQSEKLVGTAGRSPLTGVASALALADAEQAANDPNYKPVFGASNPFSGKALASLKVLNYLADSMSLPKTSDMDVEGVLIDRHDGLGKNPISAGALLELVRENDPEAIDALNEIYRALPAANQAKQNKYSPLLARGGPLAGRLSALPLAMGQVSEKGTYFDYVPSEYAADVEAEVRPKLDAIKRNTLYLMHSGRKEVAGGLVSLAAPDRDRVDRAYKQARTHAEEYIKLISSASRNLPGEALTPSRRKAMYTQTGALQEMFNLMRETGATLGINAQGDIASLQARMEPSVQAAAGLVAPQSTPGAQAPTANNKAGLQRSNVK